MSVLHTPEMTVAFSSVFVLLLQAMWGRESFNSQSIVEFSKVPRET